MALPEISWLAVGDKKEDLPLTGTDIYEILIKCLTPAYLRDDMVLIL